MSKITLECALEERISKKTNNKYTVLVIKLTDDYEKIVFLEKPEIALVKADRMPEKSFSDFLNN